MEIKIKKNTMKKNYYKIIGLIIALTCITSVNAKTLVKLKINHKMGDMAYAKNTQSTNNLGQNYDINRLEYYVSNIIVGHDGGALDTIKNKILLINPSGSFETYTLDSLNFTTIEFIQFSLVFTILALISAYLINKHLFYSLTEDDSLMKIIIIISLEMAFLTIVVFYLRKITLIIPSIATLLFSNFKPYTTIALAMHMVLIFIFIGSISKVNDKVDLLNKKMNNYMQ